MTAPAAADGPQATGGEMTGPATNGPTTGMPPGYGDPNANMSPMHMWFGPPASTWSHYGVSGLLGTVPQPGPLPPHGALRPEAPMPMQGTVPAHGGLPHQAFGGCGMPYGPYGPPMFHGAPQQMPLRPGLPHQAPMSSASVLPPQAPMSSAYNVYGIWTLRRSSSWTSTTSSSSCSFPTSSKWDDWQPWLWSDCQRFWLRWRHAPSWHFAATWTSPSSEPWQP